jgi:Leucine-rich repeat (LRR) protein
MPLALFKKSSLVSAGVRASILIAMGAFAASTDAMVPASERAVLDSIWFGTGGQLPGGTDSTWINRGGWGLPVFLGISECGSYGVTCVMDQGQEHVSAIELDENGLTGQLPPSLSDLPYLEAFSAKGNDIRGSISELSGLTKLVYFNVSRNQLAGAIPPLAGLTVLEYFDVGANQLGGSIPSLSGLTNLQIFGIYYNHLAGPIPSFAGLTNLQFFVAGENQLTGQLPTLTNMTSLYWFDVGANRLNGPIPPLSGLPNLHYFSVRSNALSGSIPVLSDLTSTEYFDVSANQLTGVVPAAPPNLQGAGLCPNRLTIADQPAVDPAWNAATGDMPWWASPSPSNLCDELLFSNFEPPIVT